MLCTTSAAAFSLLQCHFNTIIVAARAHVVIQMTVLGVKIAMLLIVDGYHCWLLCG